MTKKPVIMDGEEYRQFLKYKRAWGKLREEIKIQATFPPIRPEFKFEVRAHLWTLAKMDELLKGGNDEKD